MRGLAFDRYGNADVLAIEEVGKPVPKEGQVLVKVRAASINDWDVARVGGEITNRMMNGYSRPRSKRLGCDVAGTVEAVGAGVSEFAAGDEVYGDLCMAGFGAFAEYVAAPASALAPKPPTMSFEQAAAIPHAAMLAVQGLIDVGDVAAGRRQILLNGAGGGMGTFALQLAKQHETEVTCVDSASKLGMLRELGADHVIDYEREDFTRRGEQYDLILDAKTTRSPFDYVRVLRPGGMYATVGGRLWRVIQAWLLGGLIARFRNRQIRVLVLKPNKDLAFVAAEFEAGHLVPIIDGPFPFDDIAGAFRRFASAQHKGKVVVQIG